MRRYTQLVVPPGLAGYVAVGLKLVAQKLREQSIAVPDEVDALRLEATAVHSGSSTSEPLPDVDTGGMGTETLLLRYAEVARLLGCSTSTVKRLVETGDLSPVRLGGRPRIRRADLDEYVASLEGGSFRDRIKTKDAPAGRPAPAGAARRRVPTLTAAEEQP